MKPSVTVLMSTYNGEKFLKEQIDSVLNQKQVDVKLVVRDDGSKDNTLSIINDYISRGEKVELLKGNNIGPMLSFFSLIEHARGSMYYAFCDQDDYWLDDKLISAITQLEQNDTCQPALYCSNLEVVDENLHFCRLSHSASYNNRSRYGALVDFFAVGCTEVFNNPAAELMRKYQSKKTLMHDSWLFLLCSFWGNVIYDKIPHIKYRQHGNNVIGSNKNILERAKDSLRRVFNRSLQPRLKNAEAFLKECGNELNVADREKIERLVFYKKSIKNRLLLLFDRDIRSASLIGDLKYRLLIVLGMV